MAIMHFRHSDGSEQTIEFDEYTNITVKLDNGKQLELANIPSTKGRDSLFVKGATETVTTFSVRVGPQGSLLIIPD